MNPGPPPSIRAFIHDLPNIALDTKVRFLGCIDSYDVSKGVATLKHHFPRSLSAAAAVTVDLELVIESLTAEDEGALKDGSWVNVVGYVVRAPGSGETPSGSKIVSSAKRHGVPHVQALLVWDAGPLDIGVYERVISEAKEVERYASTIPGN